jgi:sulfonate transport system substrate-binding protein
MNATYPSGRRRRLLPLAVGLAVSGLLAAACSSAASGPAKDAVSRKALSQLTLRVGDQAGAGAEALLTAAGLIKKLPFKVAWSDFTSGPPMLEAMNAGAIDIGSVGDAPPVFAAAGGDKLAIIGATKTDPNDAALLVPKNSPIHTIAQLRGKKIGVAEGSSGDYHLLTVLTKAGLTVKDVSIDDLQPAEALAAFASGHLDAWDVWSPYIQQAEVEDGARVLVNGSGFGSPYSFTVASRAALSDPTKVVAMRDYLSMLDKAYVWAGTHPAAWAKYWAQSTGLPQGIMLTAAKDDVSTPVPITSAVIASEQQVSNAFSAAGLIPVHVDFAKFAYTGFNSTLGSTSS